MEFLFYLIGGSHPLFKMQVQNRQMLLNNSDKLPASTLSLSLFVSLSLSFFCLALTRSCFPLVPAISHTSANAYRSNLDGCRQTLAGPKLKLGKGKREKKV